MGSIYGIARGDGEIRYIGMARDARVRWATHVRDARRGSLLPVHCWIRKHGSDVDFLILEEVLDCDMNEAERGWIAYGRDRGWRLLNCTDGGEGSLGCKPSAETRARLSAFQRSRKRAPHSAETRAKIAASKTGVKQSPEHNAARAAARRGRKMSEAELEKHRGHEVSAETRAKIAASLTGRHRPPEVGAKISATKKGKPSPMRGVPFSEEHKAALRVPKLTHQRKLALSVIIDGA